MSGPPSRRVEQAVVVLVIVTVCLEQLRSVLPHLIPSIVVVAVLLVAVRIAFDRTRPW